MSIFQISPNLSFLSAQNPLSLPKTAPKQPILTITNGGGPRTFPGGVSKWQWKRMQAKKAKQLLKARLAREREVYEMRKRAELKAAVLELERPWETVKDCAPRLFSVSADEQVKVLADRFQKPGGFDMWSERDGPQLFSLVDGIPSARFFPEGVVHSTKPYGKIAEDLNAADKLSLPGSFSEFEDDVETNGYGNSGRFSDNLSGEGQTEGNRWIENTVNRNESGSSGKLKNKSYKKIGGNSYAAEKLSLSSSVFDVRDDVKRNGYKNSDGVGNSLSGERQIKANKLIKNPKDRKEMISSNGKFKKQPYQKIGKNSNVAERLSLPSLVSGVKDDIARNGYKNLDRFRGSLSSEGKIKANTWLKNSIVRNEKIGNHDKFRNKPIGKFDENANGAENLSFPRSFSGDLVQRNAYQKPGRFNDGLSRDGRSKDNKSAQNSTYRKGESYSDGKHINKGSTRRFRVKKANTSNESRGLSSEVYDMNLRDDGSYEFEL